VIFLNYVCIVSFKTRLDAYILIFLNLCDLPLFLTWSSNSMFDTSSNKFYY